MISITQDVARKVLTTVDAGLVKGVGAPKPGEMCVEAAVCYALGLPHGDDPGCVAPSLRNLKIRLNDSNWSSKEARAQGLRRLALIQLGSKDNLDEKEFAKRLVKLAITKSVPFALRAAASVHKDKKHQTAMFEAANRCEKEGTREAARQAKTTAADAYAAAAYAAAADAYAAAAYAYADAADAAADAYAYAAADAAYADAKKNHAIERDKYLSGYAEDVVKILIDLKVPGRQWLYLAD